ncbi:beta-glucosidase family protein [Streptomyces rugosispiralis]|uniref:Glycoside hydrolase family 3 C-terminal domain-containing protein n=1 Tax=Streptomyces rugosispiralis TaxID=2967341 RepID=A0ABT1UQP4_9ACTN|nr:glycoside hydrolase family 3 C-terminal domain-containing protein [Streptomyces rugosispiralis]MCQ8187433.1 glycoside hydrolase family 3 C-terminal domain-containing protein [Streptomyces rugosispiralis]
MPGALSRRSALSLLGGAMAVAATGGGGWPVAAAEPATGLGPEPGSRVDSLIGRMTLEEKLALLHGTKDPHGLGQAGHTPGVPRLGIPPLRLADGPAGVRVARHATALPAPVLLASAFDPALAREYGRVLGREGRALGQDVLLSPMVNLIRTPYAGRNFETFGEDPLLASELVAEEVRGIQGEGLIATVKHFAMNNQERERESIDVIVDERTMREMELPGFEAAVRAGAGAVMGAYNKVNGAFAGESGPLLTGVLREDWGFDGWVMTDWHAAHSTAAALGAGLDMEMPDGTYFGDALRKAVADGTVPEAEVDRAVGRVLTVMDRFGLLDGGTPPRPGRDPAAGSRTALKVATAGGVLLRNEHGTLPLTGSAARSIAVVGPTGSIPFVSGGGSAHVVPDHAASPLETIRERAGKGARVRYALGEDVFGEKIPASALSPATGLEKRKVAAGGSWTYDGTLTVAEADEWTFVLHFGGPPTGRPKVLLDGEELFPFRSGLGEYFTGGLVSAAPDGLAVRRAAVKLTAGKHRLKITAKGGGKGLAFRLRRTTSATRAADVAGAVRAARAAHSVVLFAYEDATEGRDRTTIALPGHQNALIAAVAEANPRTTVVLNTSSCVSMPWLKQTGAVLQMYYPGQEGAAATTALLFGDANPGGRLTQSFPVSDDRHPMAGDPRRYPGVNGREEYSEGVHVGYRWYDAEGVRPLFPFGHGLSYTTFAYAGLRLRRRGSGLEAVFTVRNTGRRAGAEVAQVYVGPSPDLPLDQAVRALAGFRRVQLRPGQARKVTVRVTARTLSAWDSERHGWVLGTGRRTVEVGSSSRDRRLRGHVEIRHGS